MKKRMQWMWRIIGITTIIAAVLLFSFRGTILLKAGRFMAPEVVQTDGIADVIILEGTTFISRGMIEKGMELLSTGKARRLVIVLHRIAPHHRPFAMNDDYPASVGRELKSLGLKDADFSVIVTHIHNPVTLISAHGALATLSKEGIGSAILVSSGFHMRRSFLVYQHLAQPLKIRIYPVACFDRYTVHNWWNQAYGPRDFFSEAQKLVIYIVGGHIPMKLSY